MQYTALSKPGMGDPSWYEWSVGLSYIIDMFRDDSGIDYVELQALVSLGLDDIVVTYRNGKKLFIQVKHTRVEETLTFGDLVSANQNASATTQKKSLLHELASAWYAEKEKYSDSKVCLFTNRVAGKIDSSTREKEPIKRPALREFIKSLQAKLATATSLSDVCFHKYEKAWEEWLNQLSDIGNEEDKLLFLKSLEIKTEQCGLTEIENDLKAKLQEVFGTTECNAETLLANLDHALREWTSSTRGNSRIYLEDVYRALSLNPINVSYNHDLIPNEPFFESRNSLVQEIESELSSGTNNVIFLSGVAGTGKTNIISKLSAKHNSAIDIRYYAYEPIDPAKEYLPMDVSKRVDKVTFWNELFNQLRKILNGKLSQYKVPVINELMSLEQMRESFFRIASAYAADCNRNFVIAIDGIDHAARSGQIEQTFLPTLPDPEYIPSNIKILIAGQPKENYANYPGWLYSSESVRQIDVPSIQSSDILSLIVAKLPAASETEQGQLCELISKYAEGNTLAAVFAVHEALQQPNLYELEKRFINRKLSGNIQEYYSVIWENAISRITGFFVDYRIAGVLAFFNERIDENKPHDVFPSEQISVNDWRNVLKALRPLLIEANGQYTLLHNDVRVFLASIIGKDKDHVKEVYSGLADYYIGCSAKSVAYYNDIFRFLEGSDRLLDFSEVYCPDFIIGAYVNGVELSDLSYTSAKILKTLLAHMPVDWEQMKVLSMGCMTIDQLEKSGHEIEDCSFRHVSSHIPIHPFECFVEPEAVWNPSIISDVLTLTKKLYSSGYDDRADQLFKRWFSEMKLSEIVEKVKLLKEDDDNWQPERQVIASLLGECVVLSSEYDMLDNAPDLVEDHPSFLYNFTDSALRSAIKSKRGDELAKALSHTGILYYKPVISCIQSLVVDNRFDDIGIFAAELFKRRSDNPMAVMLVSFMQIVSSRQKWDDAVKEALWEKVEPLDFKDVPTEQTLLYYSIYAVVAAYLQPVSFSITACKVLEKYLAQYSYHSRAYMGVYFHNVCLIGKWLSQLHAGAELYVDTDTLEHLLGRLLIEEWDSGSRDFESQKYYGIILKAFIMLSEHVSPKDRTAVDEICDSVFSNHPVNSLLDAGAFYYRNNAEKLKEWFDSWFCDNGHVWNVYLYERNQIIKDFVSVTERYHLDINVSPIIERAQWSIIGYASHKEYSCDYLLNWYNSLIGYKDDYIREHAEIVKAISDQVETVGDNRLHYHINAKFYEDSFSCGYDLIKDTLHNNRFLAQGIEDPNYLVDGLIGYLKHGEQDSSTLLEIWAMGTALLDWRNEDDHATIADLQKAIVLCAKRSGIDGIYDRLKELSPAYVDLVQDPSKYIIPERWCDGPEKHPPIDEANSVVRSFLSGIDNAETYQLFVAVKSLRESESISNEDLTSVLQQELNRQSYGIRQNTLVQYLVEMLPAELSDSIIANYIMKRFEKDSFNMNVDLPLFVLWRGKQEGEEYCKSGLDALIAAHRSWLTSAGHFPAPTITADHSYTDCINWNEVNDLGSLFYQIVKYIVLSDDADAARVALSGLFNLARVNSAYVERLERDWNQFHYRAKEWLLMVYELLLDVVPEIRELIMECVRRHCTDEDFNIALYSNILIDNRKTHGAASVREPQAYFDSIPSNGHQRLLKLPQNGPWMDGQKYVMRVIELMEDLYDWDFSDLEMRTADYSQSLEAPSLHSLNRRRIGGGCAITLYPVNVAFFRVLYKDWVNNRWNGVETELARLVLTSSEPYITLISPARWTINSGSFFGSIGEFEKQPEIAKEQEVQRVLNEGLDDDDYLIAGSVVDYTYNKEIIGVSVSYIKFGDGLHQKPLEIHERNSRLLLQSRDDFEEQPHFNVSLNHSGVESFQLSGMICGLSKTALISFGWEIRVSSKGLYLVDNSEQEIGRFEFFCGSRDIGNRYVGNQPQLQRWIVKKWALEQAKRHIPKGTSIANMVHTIVRPGLSQ